MLIANPIYDTEDQFRYEHSLKVYRDLINVVDTAYEDGVAVMKQEVEVAKAKIKQLEDRLKQAGLKFNDD